ncbi:hypothetical protein FOZ61_005612 [Perkinsus olseni]|uniref:RING-type domain-containing protein n=1 Tax=Perkinsus olseni TaxID=32597 RepID=A0A7J6MBR6_PEROL|nr:hypothetical protein FOZ61_005612 [Perkinsus olseni]
MTEGCLSLGASRSLLREQEESVGRIVLLVAMLMVLFTTCFVILVYVSHFCLTYDAIEYIELPAGPYDSPPRSRSNRLVVRARLVARRAVTALRHGGHAAAAGLVPHPLSLQQQSHRRLHCPSSRLKDLTKGRLPTCVCPTAIVSSGTLCGGQRDCPICLSQYEDIDTVTHLPCRHLFHLDCLEKYRIPAFPDSLVFYASSRWFNRSYSHPSCPLCRQHLPFVEVEAPAAVLQLLPQLLSSQVPCDSRARHGEIVTVL